MPIKKKKKKKYNDGKQRDLAQDLPNGWDAIMGEFNPRAIQYKTHHDMKMVYEKRLDLCLDTDHCLR